jgi:hypothetical protein
VKIERGIPIPRLRGKYQDTFDRMKIGESVLFPHDRKRSAQNAAQVAGVNGKRFTVKHMADGYRVWRVK